MSAASSCRYCRHRIRFISGLWSDVSGDWRCDGSRYWFGLRRRHSPVGPAAE